MSRRDASPVVILSPGWVGDLVLVRLLSASGRVRSSGSLLGERVDDPAGHLLRRLRRSPGGEPVHAAVVHPNDLWLVNQTDPVTVVNRWSQAGVRFVVLGRERLVDRGLSHEVCGPLEILPPVPQAVAPHEVLLAAEDADAARDWFDRIVPGAQHVTFETDLATADGRAATVKRLASWLDLDPWTAPPEPNPPTSAALWSRVIDADRVKEEVETLAKRVGRELGPVGA